MGKRQIGELQPSELVVTLLISDIAAVPMQETGIPLLNGIIPIFTLVALEIVISCLMVKFDCFRKLISGKPVIIIRDGKLLQKEMRRVRFTIEDLIEALRLQNIFRIEDIDYAIVETNGKLSVLPKPDKMPVDTGMLGLSGDNAGLPMVVVSDGEPLPYNLGICGLDEGWLYSTLQKQNISVQDVFLMTADRTRNFYIVKKQKKEGRS